MSEVLTSLTMPLRDVVRTLRAASHAAEPILRPSARFLPPPLQHLVAEAARRAEDLGERMLDMRAPADAEIATARRALTAPSPSLEMQAGLARVMAFGLTEATERRGREDWIVGESRLALLVAEAAGASADLPAALARLARLVLRSHAVAGLGDIVPTRSGEAEGAREAAVFAVALWLALDRDGAEDEARLLQLAIEVTLHMGAEIARAARSEEATAALLRRLSGVI